MTDTVTLPKRFSGPPGVGNGGYACGRFAALLGGPAEVTLRRPVPLDTALTVDRQGDPVRVLDGGALVAEVARTDLAALVAPPPVSLEQAVLGASRFPLADHPFPTCFVCGPRREALDGLRIHAYGTSAEDGVSSPWVPSASLAGPDGAMPAEIVWASLDCPTGWAGLIAMPGEKAVLGRFAVRIEAPVVAERVHVVVARSVRSVRREGRKLFAIGGLYTAGGQLCAVSRATWIVVD